MRIDSGLLAGGLEQAGERAKGLEGAGFDGLITAETGNDPFFPLILAAEHTQRIQLITSIAVAFARTPMNLAYIGHDLNAYSKGRFVLGVGSQIQPHITKRFSMPWSHPARRMREFILAMRAIWDAWYERKKLDFRGEFYTHTLMTPMFTPPNAKFGPPRVWLAAVGPQMTEVAGEVADGVIAHGFTTKRYMEQVTLPAIERGLKKSGRKRDQFEISYPGFVVTGRSADAYEQSRTAVSKQIAFYGSTPAYRPVLELHGWGELQGELNALSKQGKWDEMGTRITDEILEEFAVVAEPKDVARQLRRRFDGLVDRIACTVPLGDAAERSAFLQELRA